MVHVLCCLSLLLLLLLLTDLPGCSTFGPPREATTRLHWHRAPTGMRPAARPSRHVPCYVRVSFVSRRMMMMILDGGDDDDDDDDGWTTRSRIIMMIIMMISVRPVNRRRRCPVPILGSYHRFIIIVFCWLLFLLDCS